MHNFVFIRCVIPIVIFANCFSFSYFKRIWCSQTFDDRVSRARVKEHSVLARWVSTRKIFFALLEEFIREWPVNVRVSLECLRFSLAAESNGVVIVNPAECLSWFSLAEPIGENRLFSSFTWFVIVELKFVRRNRRSRFSSFIKEHNAADWFGRSTVFCRKSLKGTASPYQQVDQLTSRRGGPYWPAAPLKFPMTMVKQYNYESLIAITMPGDIPCCGWMHAQVA